MFASAAAAAAAAAAILTFAWAAVGVGAIKEVVVPVIAVPVPVPVPVPEGGSAPPHVLPQPTSRCRDVVDQILSHNGNKSRETLTNQFHKQTRDVDYYYRGVAYICELCVGSCG